MSQKTSPSKTNLKSGTNITEDDKKNILSSSDIVSIIEVSGKSGVTELKFGGLFVKFGKPADLNISEWGIKIPLAREDKNLFSNSPDKEISATQQQVALEALEQDEMNLRERQLADLFIEDPAKAEELIRNGHLEEADGADEET